MGPRGRAAAILVASQALLAGPLLAQRLDYHLEETPAVSWNGVGFQDARMLSLGSVSLLASAPFLASTNPALIPTDCRYSLGVSGARLAFEAMRYWGVNQGSNQGALASLSPPSDVASLASGIAGHLETRGIGLAAGWYVGRVLRFPDFESVTYYGDYTGGRSWTTKLAFSGQENVFFLAAALPKWKGLRLGGKLEYVSGRREVSIRSVYHDYWWIDSASVWLDVVQRQEQSHRTRSFTPSLGVSWQITRSWTVGGQAAWPLDGTADRSLTRAFEVRPNGVSISDNQTASDRLHRPQQATLGTAVTLDLWKQVRLRLGAEATYTRWSGYRYEFFGEEQPRDLRDTFVLAGGMEVTFRTLTDVSLRLGYRRDPQPVKEPSTTLQAFSGGLGVKLGQMGLEAGAVRYHGSAGGTDQTHTVLALTLQLAAR